MKYLVLFVILFVVVWWLRKHRSRKNSPTQKKSTDANTMLACTHCGLHVPEAEAVFGKQLAHGDPAVYCSQQHLQNHEGN
jgi:uncharacterized protein